MKKLFFLGCLLSGFALRSSEVIQVDVQPVLTGRAVTTLTGGRLVPWTQGIDGAGRADGYLTLSASVANGDKNARALPDDGCFPATAAHPFVRLNFSNADGRLSQTRGVEGQGVFTLPVPVKPYQRLMVFLTSSEGPSHLSFKLGYADGSVASQEILLPDYYNAPPAGDPHVFTLAANLAKWNAAGKMAERDHHYIHGVNLHPDPRKNLVSVTLNKTAPAYLVFWGATAVTAD